MPREVKTLPPKRTDFTFVELFDWYVYKFGARPHINPSEAIGEPWSPGEFCAAIKEEPRKVRNWFNGTNLPNAIPVMVWRTLFGDNPAWGEAKVELQRKFEEAWAERSAARQAKKRAKASQAPSAHPGSYDRKDTPSTAAPGTKDQNPERPQQADTELGLGSEAQGEEAPLDKEGPASPSEPHEETTPSEVAPDESPILRVDRGAEKEPARSLVPEEESEAGSKGHLAEVDPPETTNETHTPMPPVSEIAPAPKVVVDDAPIVQEEPVGPSEPVTETDRQPGEPSVSQPVGADGIKKENRSSPPPEPVTEIARGPETSPTEAPIFPNDRQPNKEHGTRPDGTGPTGPGPREPTRAPPTGKGGDNKKKESRWYWRPDPKKAAGAVLLLLAGMSGLWLWTHYTPTSPVTKPKVEQPPDGGAKPRPDPQPGPGTTAESIPLPRPRPAGIDPLAEPPMDKALACVLGDEEIRELFAAQLRQMVTGLIIVGDCTRTQNRVVIHVSGIARTPSAGASCSTPDQHVYELGLTIDKAGKEAGPIPATTAARCGNRDLNLDRQAQRDARNEAVTQAARSARQLLNDIGEP